MVSCQIFCETIVRLKFKINYVDQLTPTAPTNKDVMQNHNEDFTIVGYENIHTEGLFHVNLNLN